MSDDFYGNPSPTVPTPLVVVSKYGAPPMASFGPDGIPNYVDATKGSPFQYLPPPGRKLAIYHNVGGPVVFDSKNRLVRGARLRHIVIADRLRGFAIGRHYRENKDWTVDFLPWDENGVHQERFYEGHIVFRLIYGPGPKVFGLKG